MRLAKPELLVAVLVLIVLGWNLWYTHSVVNDLREDARRSSAMFARVFRAFGDTTPGGADAALSDLSAMIGNQGVPLILTTLYGTPRSHLNLPFDADNTVPDEDPRIKAYIPMLARLHP